MKSKIERLGKVSITVEKDYWNKNKPYDRLTIVERQGTRTAYLSRKVVPIGVEITDRNYWITISKWNDIPYEIVQELGDSPELVISQKVVTLKINELQGFIDNINDIIGEGGSIDERITTAKSELVDGASEEGDTLKKLEDRLSDVEGSVGEGGSVDERIAEEAAKHYTKEETYSKEELNNLITTPNQQYVSVASYQDLPATGATNTIYRVGGTTSYSEYAWNGTTYILLSEKSIGIDDDPTTDSNNLVKSGGVANSLSALAQQSQAEVGYYECSTDADVAAKTIAVTGYSLRVGGNIHIKMINANTADVVTLNINNTGVKSLFYNGVQASSTNSWDAGEVVEVYYDGTRYQCGGRIVDDKPTAGSNNLIKSGGVYSSTPTVAESTTEFDLGISDEEGNVIIECSSGGFRTKNFDSAKTPVIVNDTSDADLNIGDASGNVIVEYKNGGLKTKNIDLSVTNYFEQDIKFIEPRSGAPARLWTSSTLTNKTKDEWLVIYCHGNGHSRDTVSIPQAALLYFRRNKINVATISYQTTLYGESCEAWGSDAAYNAIVDLYTYLMGNYGFRRDVILAGGSMGGLAMGQLAYKRPFPIRCCLGFGIVPGLDICWERSSEYSPTIKARIRQTFGLAADGSQDSLYAQKSIGYDYRKYGWITIGETDYKVGFPNFYIYYGNDSTISGLFGGVENYNVMCQAFINAGMYSVVKSVGTVVHDSPTIWDAYVQDNIFYKELQTEKYIS